MVARLLAFTVIIVILTALFVGYTREMPPVAGLEPLGPETLKEWGIPGNLALSGTGNSTRVVRGASLAADKALELAAGGQGSQEYFREIGAGSQVQANCRLLFLSTQGAGRIKLSALDADNRVIATLGWVYTGQIPPEDGRTKWLDARYIANYIGEWITFDENVTGLLGKHLPAAALSSAAKYRLSVEAGQGQHVLITACQLASQPEQAVRLTPQTTAFAAILGDLLTVQVGVENTGREPLDSTTVEVVEPYGFGLVVAQDRVRTIANLAPGEKRLLAWQVRAQRPDAVNMHKPWELQVAVGGKPAPGRIMVAVADPRPGRVYYVMTEDLEPIDSAGYPAAWGNADGWLQPEELQAQMVTKAEKLNSIAGQYGAKWTHYIAWPVIKAGEWASGRSSSGEWPKVIAAIRQSVRDQSAQGHEYAIHLHSDYDPYLPGNVLSYNPTVDGLWANHLQHGWAHSLPAEGGLDYYASRAGMLYAYQRILDELAADSPHGQLLTARAGSFDFGDGAASEAMSTRAYRKAGLWAGSDADGNSGGITAADYGREIYFTKPDDINTAAVDLQNIGIVEFSPTPREFINYDSQPAAAMNDKVDLGMAYFAPGGAVKPGVHAIVGFTHGMFMMGEGDWRSTQGGQFAALDGHLRYLKERYQDKGQLHFGTANELTKAYLDYYTPLPVAVYGPRLNHSSFVSEYPLVILGRDIPIDPTHPHAITVKYPLYLRESAFCVSILKDGNPIVTSWNLPTSGNDVSFTVNDAQAQYSLRIYHNNYLAKIQMLAGKLKAKISQVFTR